MHRDMNSKKGIVLLFACVFLAIAAQCAEKEEPASPEALISRARLQEEVWAEGTPPMLMRAELRVFDAKVLPQNKFYYYECVDCPLRGRSE